MEQVHGTATVTITLAWAAVLPAESLKGSTKAEVLQDNHENTMRSKVLNSCIQQSFSKKGVVQTRTEVVFGKDMSRWRLPKSSKCACTTVSEQNLSSPYTTEEVIEGGVIISKKPLLIILGPSGSQSLEACEPITRESTSACCDASKS